ncbi:MAG TPA: TetR family transcriptional regulator [Caulobacteraceae bacterium]|nr:TetR family transcriptional regulator [Caulobacteraceae bacterium]
MADRTTRARKPRRTTTAGQATRERILAAAERLFAAQGFAGVSMPQIAQASGITAGAIYKHFASKADLFFQVVTRAVQEAPVGSEPSLPAAVAAYTTRRLRQVRQMAVEVHYAAAKDADVRRLLRASLDRQISDIAAGLSAAQAAGDVAGDDDPALVASAIMVFIMGLMHLETLKPSLIGDAAWAAFVKGRAEALLGAR